MQNFIKNLPHKKLLKYTASLSKTQIFQISLAFNQISLRLHQNPQTINQIIPKKEFIKNLILLSTIVNKGLAIFKSNNQKQRNQYLCNFLRFISNIFNQNDNFYKNIKKKVTKNKNFIRNISSISLFTTDTQIGYLYTILLKKIKQQPLNVIQRKQICISLIKNTKYVIQNNVIGEIFIELNCILRLENNLISQRIIKKHKLIQNIEIVLESIKNISIYSQGLNLLIRLMRIFKNTKRLFNHSNAYKKFYITEQMKEYLLKNNTFQYNYILYFSNSCQFIPTQEMCKITQYFMLQLNQLYQFREKLSFIQGQIWLYFLLQIVEHMITIGRKQQNIGMLLKLGIFQTTIKLIKLKLQARNLQHKIFQLIIDILNHLETDSPYHFYYYLSLSLGQLKQLLEDQNDINQQTQIYLKRMVDKFQKHSFRQLELQ